MQQVSYYTVLYPHIYDLNNLLGQDSMGILHIPLRKKSFIRPVKIHNLESDQLMLLNDFLLMKFHFNVNSYYKPLCTSKAYVYIYIYLSYFHRPGQMLSVTFQKNLDHFLSASPVRPCIYCYTVCQLLFCTSMKQIMKHLSN